jgi:hypothetical protein
LDLNNQPEDWKFGARSDKVVLQPDGQWDDYLPTFEHQATGYETSGCTCYGTLSQMEAYFKRVFGFEPNYAERYNYVLAGVTIDGANPQNAYESVRKWGVIDEKELPRPDTYEEYNSPIPMLSKYTNQGSLWLEDWEFTHEWIVSRTGQLQPKIVDALKYSPVAVAVSAWLEKDGLYISEFDNNHWCLAYGYEQVGDKYRLKVFDTYDKSVKLLHEDHDISVAKRINIKKKVHTIEGNWLIDLLKRLWGLITG